MPPEPTDAALGGIGQPTVASVGIDAVAEGRPTHAVQLPDRVPAGPRAVIQP